MKPCERDPGALRGLSLVRHRAVDSAARVRARLVDDAGFLPPPHPGRYRRSVSDWIQAILETADEHYRLAEYAEAQPYYEKLVQHEVRFADVFNRLGTI